MGRCIDIPSGKHTKNYGKIHHAINGKIHYFDWAIFNSYVTNYQRVWIVQLIFRIWNILKHIETLKPIHGCWRKRMLRGVWSSLAISSQTLWSTSRGSCSACWEYHILGWFHGTWCKSHVNPQTIPVGTSIIIHFLTPFPSMARFQSTPGCISRSSS